MFDVDKFEEMCKLKIEDLISKRGIERIKLRSFSFEICTKIKDRGIR